jgi:hypothetical protein
MLPEEASKVAERNDERLTAAYDEYRSRAASYAGATGAASRAGVEASAWRYCNLSEIAA